MLIRVRPRYFLHALVAGAAVLSFWLVASEPWGLRAYQLLMFTAPGALLGLGAGWMANAATATEWSWQSGRRASLLGAAILPPFLAFLIAVDGSVQPQRLLAGFVYAAWFALLGGAVVAAVRWIVRGRIRGGE